MQSVCKLRNSDVEFVRHFPDPYNFVRHFRSGIFSAHPPPRSDICTDHLDFDSRAIIVYIADHLVTAIRSLHKSIMSASVPPLTLLTITF